MPPQGLEPRLQRFSAKVREPEGEVGIGPTRVRDGLRVRVDAVHLESARTEEAEQRPKPRRRTPRHTRQPRSRRPSSPRVYSRSAARSRIRKTPDHDARAAYSLAAFLTSAATNRSSAGENSVTAKAVGHIVPSSSCAASKNARFPYRALNFARSW